MKALLILALIVVSALGAHLALINYPPQAQCVTLHGNRTYSGCIMDEFYYVGAANGILANQCASLSADKCNLEHPPLVKLMISAGIVLFGNTEFGWRIFTMLTSLLAIIGLYYLVIYLSGDEKLALLSAGLLALDPLYFMVSSAALLDGPALAVSLVALAVYFRRGKHSLLLSGLLFGVAALMKETAFIIILGLVFYLALVERERTVKRILSVSLLSVAVFAAGMVLFLVTMGVNIVSEALFFITYPTLLTGLGGWPDAFFHFLITPLNWIVYYTPVNYSLVSGAPFIAAPIMPLVWISVLKFVRLVKGSVYNEAVLIGWFFFLTTFFFFVMIWLLDSRLTYPFYFIQSVPFVDITGAWLLLNIRKPYSWLLWGSVGAWLLFIALLWIL